MAVKQVVGGKKCSEGKNGCVLWQEGINLDFLARFCWRILFFEVESKNIDQGIFCHDQVSSGKFLEFFNLRRNLQMFLDTMEPSLRVFSV